MYLVFIQLQSKFAYLPPKYWDFPCCCSVAKSCPTLCNPMDCSAPGFPVQLSPWVCWNSCSLSWWCYLTISSSATPFSFCLPSFPASGSFPKSQLFTSGGQVLEFQHQSFQWILRVDFLLSKGLSRVFSYITIQKHQFFGAQPSLWFNSHICTWLLEKP